MILSEWIYVFVAVILKSTYSLHISEWYPIEAQVTNSAVTIPHPLRDKPARVEVLVKVQENGRDVIFPASGSAQRDDDSDNVYGGVVYFYNEHHVKIFVPFRNRDTDKGVIIYSGGSSFTGPFPACYVNGEVRVKVWSICDLPQANFTSPGDVSISLSNFKTVSHGLGTLPDLVVVQVVMSNGYISEAGGVTFNSERNTKPKRQSICGTIFAFNHQDIRVWAMSDYVACALDGWGSEEISGTSGTLYIQAWLLDSCKKKFSKSFMMDKNNVDTTFPTVDNVQFDTSYSLSSTIVSVQMKVFTSNNDRFVFYAGGSAMIDTTPDPYGAILYGYTETEVFLWRPHKDTSNGYLVYVGGEWGYGDSSQQATVVEVTVKVIELDDSPCSETDICVSSWSSHTSFCTSTDCPIPDDIPNAHKLYNSLTDGSIAMYACMPGYATNSYDSVIHCVSGIWSSSDMNCNVVCPLPPDIPNADVMVEKYTARYFCTSGFYQLENTEDLIICDGNKWEPTNFECIKICGAPPTIANAELMRYNNKAMYSCREGYRSMSGSHIINCTESIWLTTTFSCYALSCGPAPTIHNADVLVNDDGAMYSCHFGYKPSSTNNRIVCIAGVWSLTNFQCLFVCLLPPDIPNAELMVDNNTARYFCAPGYYQLENTDDFIICEGKKWQPTNFECIQICRAPPTIANAEVMRYNNIAMYSCWEGYRSMSGSNRINCTQSIWQTTKFSCFGGSGSTGGLFNNHSLERWIRQIKEDLLVDKRNTSAYMRTLISVYDPRPASIAIGGSGVVLLCIAIFILALSDVLTFCKYNFRKMPKATETKP